MDIEKIHRGFFIPALARCDLCKCLTMKIRFIIVDLIL